MQADSCADVDAHSCSDIDAHSCSDIDSYALADRHTDACADVDSYALADRHAHAGADVHVRTCLHAPYHARCGLTRTGMHDDACACPRPRNHGPPRIMSPSCSHLRRDRAGTAQILVHIRARTEADLRCD